MPIHGALTGVGICAHQEMEFMRRFIVLAKHECITENSEVKPLLADFRNGVSACLQSALSLRTPVLVFSVDDMISYEPLPGMSNYAIRDASLPNKGMISCLICAGGRAPSHWDVNRQLYAPSIIKNETKHSLRDVLLMKPRSTVDDVFLGLKHIGALDAYELKPHQI